MTDPPGEAKKSIEDTGERMVPDYHKGSMMYAEHMVRYQAAGSLVKDKVVLDIACGSGYGSSILARQAARVMGVDLSEPAIEYAQQNYGAANIGFRVGDATDIPIGDESVDVVVSFETIEHIPDYKKFLKEVRRVLKAEGLFIVSTPNDKEFPEGADFHAHEFKQEELEALLRQHFENTRTYYQSTWLYNALMDE
ncbi:class I SAM-dependent methyltransferase, partial [Candidatus Saccharibacteria bacterium CG10_big_fil_rev_8_21_14_0_10_47_8]